MAVPPQFSFPHAPPRRREERGYRWRMGLVALAVVLVCGCATPTRPPVVPAVAYLVLENQTDYEWEIQAAPATPAAAAALTWRVAPATAITVELAAPAAWSLKQTLLDHGTMRTTEFEAERGVTYRWPLATLHSIDGPL